MAWQAVADVPFVPVAAVYFSQIIGAEFYVIDRGQNFYRCHIGTGVWTQLANPPFTAENVHRCLTYRNGLLYCIDEGGAAEPLGRRISWYNPTTNTWASSAQVPFAVSQFQNIKSFCFADDDTIWAWVKRTGIALRMKCVRYVISTDTWTEFPNDTGVLAVNQARSAAINAARTIVYGSCMGAFAMSYGNYTIPTDVYWQSGNYAGYNWVWAADPLRLWYQSLAGGALDWRYGYFDIATLAFNSNYWEAGPPTRTSMSYAGIDLQAIVSYIGAVNPMVWWNGAIFPTVETSPATEIK